MKKIVLLLFITPFFTKAQTSHNIYTGMHFYNPNYLEINQGDTVFWINEGGNHNVNFDISTLTSLSFNNPESFISNPTSSLDIYSHIFTIPGTYNYDCSVYGHASSGMTGSIVVNSISSITEKYYTNKKVKIFDFFGRQTTQSNRILLYLYDNGKVEKKLILN